jgi:hypothetical protein
MFGKSTFDTKYVQPLWQVKNVNMYIGFQENFLKS